MAVIKSSSADRIVKDAIVLDFGDINRQAEAVLDSAQRESERIIAEARAEAVRRAQEIAEQARREGLAHGTAEGREAGRTEGRQEVLESFGPQLEELVASWRTALERWDAEHGEMLLLARDEVLVFAFEMARRIIHRQIEADPTIVVDQIEQALRLATRPSALSVRINPEDRAVVEGALPELLSAFGAAREAGLRDDADIARGGCVVSTAGGAIDASIDAQIERIASTLLPSKTVDDDGTP